MKRRLILYVTRKKEYIGVGIMVNVVDIMRLGDRIIVINLV